MKKIKTCIALAAGLSALSHTAIADLAEETYRSLVDASGRIRLPADYRKHWSHLGSWLVADPKAPGYGFHDVYTQREAVDGFRKNGYFPDGTVLIKEIRTPEAGERTTGRAQWAGAASVWFMMIKDAKDRFKNDIHWQDGWGWALFESKNPMLSVSQGYAASCKGCHLPAAKTDRVYIEGYPTLRGDQP